jgi:hypothetical protein
VRLTWAVDAGKAEGAEGVRAVSPGRWISTALTASSAALISCARIEPPPGGPPDPTPPQLVATRPDSFAQLPGFKGDVEFRFDEVISEGGTPNRGEGTGGLEKLVILSPTSRVPEVSWRRNRITVRPREGWRPNRVYRVQLLPGVTDLRNNRTKQGAVLTFTTGAPKPETTLQGQVVDWTTSRPAASALVIATLLPDSLAYRGVADSSGHFALGPLPAGDYVVSGVLDQNNDQLQDSREAYASTKTPRGKTDVGELWAFVHDTTPVRIQTVTVDDSAKATVTFSQKLDPRQRLSPRDATLRLLPDSTAVPIASLLPQPVDDSLHQVRGRPDSTLVRDSLTKRDSSRTRPRQGRGAPITTMINEPKTSRPPLFDRLVVRPVRPWTPGTRLVLEVRGIRNVTGIAANPVGVLAVPAKQPTPKDSGRVRAPRDTARVRGARDTLSTPKQIRPTAPAPPPKK